MIYLLALFFLNPKPKHEGRIFTAQVSYAEPLQQTFKPLDKLSYIVTDPTNTYPLYQCTWYAKDRRPDVPNYLGNANLWFDELAALGYSVGYTPKQGAIAQYKYGVHVAFVEQVDGDSIYISERNFDYNGSYNERWVPASDYKYIY